VLTVAGNLFARHRRRLAWWALAGSILTVAFVAIVVGVLLFGVEGVRSHEARVALCGVALALAGSGLVLALLNEWRNRP
jgi:cytochrome bd-type quinol oxidase subunit 1